ncbi:Papilin, partial [Araneus ventricosus]
TTYTADLLWNRVSNLELSAPEPRSYHKATTALIKMKFLSLICVLITFQLSLHTATAIPLLKSQPLVRHRRQVYQTNLQAGATYPNRTVGIQQSRREPEFGPWGPWAESSHCSRSCGGGIAYQDRICLDVRADGRHSCVGASRRYFSCNVDDCPPSSKDFRAQQCQRFTPVQYKGKYYNWIPYHAGKRASPSEAVASPSDVTGINSPKYPNTWSLVTVFFSTFCTL